LPLDLFAARCRVPGGTRRETFNEASLPMRRHSIIVVSTVVALIGCSDDLEPDLAACKAKAMEAHGAAPLSKERSAAYVRECMHAEGWPIKDACLDRRDMWASSECCLR